MYQYSVNYVMFMCISHDLSLYRCWLLKGRNGDISVTLFCYSCNILQSNVILSYYTGVQWASYLTELYIVHNFSGEVNT